MRTYFNKLPSSLRDRDFVSHLYELPRPCRPAYTAQRQLTRCHYLTIAREYLMLVLWVWDLERREGEVESSQGLSHMGGTRADPSAKRAKKARSRFGASPIYRPLQCASSVCLSARLAYTSRTHLLTTFPIDRHISSTLSPHQHIHSTSPWPPLPGNESLRQPRTHCLPNSRASSHSAASRKLTTTACE